MVRRIFTGSFIFLLLTHSVSATSPTDDEYSPLDSTLLNEVIVTAQSYKEVIPAQTLGGQELEALRSHSVADALRYFSVGLNSTILIPTPSSFSIKKFSKSRATRLRPPFSLR